MTDETNSAAATGAPQLSPQGLILYIQMLDDTAFIKRQQWATTNYAALLYAAMIWFKHNIDIGSCAVFTLSAAAIVTALVAFYLLIRFQYDLSKLRKAHRDCEQLLFRRKRKERARCRGNRQRAGIQQLHAQPLPAHTSAHPSHIKVRASAGG